MTAESTTAKHSRVEQCRNNARAKSEAKRQVFRESLIRQAREGKSLTKAAVCRRAGVSLPFLRAHADLLQALEQAQMARRSGQPEPNVSSRADDSQRRITEALRRQLDAKQRACNAKDEELSEKERQIRVLLGKLAAMAVPQSGDLRRELEEATRRAERAEARAKELETQLLAKRVVKMRDTTRRYGR